MDSGIRVYVDAPVNGSAHAGYRGSDNVIALTPFGVQVSAGAEWLLVNLRYSDTYRFEPGEPQPVFVGVGTEDASEWVTVEQSCLLPWHRVWLITNG